MKKVLGAVIVCFFLLVGLFLLFHYLLPWLRPDDSALQITSSIPAKVFLDSNEKGSTTYKNEKLKTGSYKIDLEAKFATESSKIAAGKEVKWSAQVNLSSHILTVVNLDFGPSEAFTAAEILSLQPGDTSVSVVSQPSGAKVTLDDQDNGLTPLNKVLKAGVHRLKLSKDGYISRQIDINVQNSYQTIVRVSLALNPLNKVGGKLLTKNSATLYDLSSDQSSLENHTDRWAEAAFFFQEKDTSASTKFDALIDRQGKIFYLDQNDFQSKLKSNKLVNLGYLGKTGEKLTDSAQKTWGSLFASPKVSQIQILSTPTGNLKVRETPSTSAKVLTIVNPGEKYDLLVEQSGWYKIQVGTFQGWVSSQYAKKL